MDNWTFQSVNGIEIEMSRKLFPHSSEFMAAITAIVGENVIKCCEAQGQGGKIFMAFRCCRGKFYNWSNSVRKVGIENKIVLLREDIYQHSVLYFLEKEIVKGLLTSPEEDQ